MTEVAMLLVCTLRRQFLKNVVAPENRLQQVQCSLKTLNAVLEMPVPKREEQKRKELQIDLLVLKSIGYKSVPVNGLTFDHHKGVVPNVRGRILSDTSEDCTQFERGLYVSGWLKRGPTGIVATNLYCAEETVVSITEDLEKGELASTSTLAKPGRVGLLLLLDGKNVRVVPFSACEKIDTEEKRLGSLKSKPREKLPTREELLRVAMN